MARAIAKRDDEERAQLVVAPSGGPSAQLRIYQEDDGRYQAVLLLRTRRHGTFAVRLSFERVPDVATAGELDELVEGVGFSPSKYSPDELARFAKLAHPAVRVAADILNHPFAAIAASASAVIPGVGPVWLISYALGQSALDWIERRLRS